MATLESLRRKVEATEDLQSVVRTMKALAAVNIRQYEQAAAALLEYRRTVELGLRVLLRHAQPRRQARRQAEQTAALVAVGTDQGMCGQFNEEVADQVATVLRSDAQPAPTWRILAIGAKLTAALTARRHPVAATQYVPGSASAITYDVRSALATIEAWQAEHGPLQRVMIVYTQYEQQETTPRGRQLLPMDEHWLGRIRARPWPTRELPLFTAPADALLSHLVRQYLFVELHGAMAESLAAENATRLRAMQSAEKNIDEQLDELNTRYNRQRQNSITAELLDVISGSEAVAG